MMSNQRRTYSYGKRKLKQGALRASSSADNFEEARETKQGDSPLKMRPRGSKSWSKKSEGRGSSELSDPFEFCEEGNIDVPVSPARRRSGAATNARSPLKRKQSKPSPQVTPEKARKKTAKEENLVAVQKSPARTTKTSPFKKFLKNNNATLSPKKQRSTKAALKAQLGAGTVARGDECDELASPLSAQEHTPFSSDGEGTPGTASIKVKREEKKLFTIVRNTKKASECLEHGESQQFMDDLQFLLDGLTASNPISTRCLSALELASKCSKSSFRMSLRAHGMAAVIFGSLSDAPDDFDLALSTSAIMFMLTRDKISIDFDRSILELMFKLLAAKDEPKRKSKTWNRLQAKLRESLTGNDILGIENLDISNLTTDDLCRESLLSFSLQRTGEWFKDEIRLLGGLDHVVDTVLQASKSIRNNVRGTLLQDTTLIQLRRCFKLIENVTYHSVENQKYLLSYKHCSLIESCGRLLHHGTAHLSLSSPSDVNHSLVLCLFSLLRTLLNLTHDCDLACGIVCKENSTLSAILWCAFQLPKFVPDDKNFDTLVLSLGLLINLVEHNPRHAIVINSIDSPPWHESEDISEGSATSCTPTESLLQLFLIRAMASENANSLTEDLQQTETSLHNASIRMSADGLSLMCGDDLDKSSVADDTTRSDPSARHAHGAKKSEEQHNAGALKKAGKHMEDSLVAAYAALLLGLLAKDDRENKDAIQEHSVVMVATLHKFLSFMKMMTERPQGSGFKAVEDVIRMLSKHQSLSVP